MDNLTGFQGKFKRTGYYNFMRKSSVPAIYGELQSYDFQLKFEVRFYFVLWQGKNQRFQIQSKIYFLSCVNKSLRNLSVQVIFDVCKQSFKGIL